MEDTLEPKTLLILGAGASYDYGFPLGTELLDDLLNIEKNTFLLYHVKESVVYESIGYTIPIIWKYGKKLIKNKFIKENIYDRFIINKHIDRIFIESQKYYSFLENCERVGYWQTVRALPINEDDCRLSDITYSEVDNKKIITVLSGKVTTCWTIAENIKNMI